MPPLRVLLVDAYVFHRNPLSLAFLKAYADAKLDRRVEIRILSACVADERMGASVVARAIADFRPAVLGFSCYLWNVEPVVGLARRFRRKCRVVLGGPEANGTGGAELLRRSGAHAVVVGEGEAAFAELLERALRGKHWEGTPGTVNAPARGLLPDIDAIPSPYLSGSIDLGDEEFLAFETQRGCPFRCAFCTWTTHGGVRTYAVPRLAKELGYIAAQTSAKFMFLADADLFRDPGRAMKVLKLLRALPGRSLELIEVQTALHHWSDALMRECDFEGLAVAVGVESINPKALKLAGRPDHTRLIEEKIVRFRKLAPKAQLWLQIICPLPGDTLADCKRLIDWAWRQQPDAIMFFRLVVLPGSRFSAEAKSFGIERMPRAPHFVIRTRECGRKDVAELNQLMFWLDACYRDRRLREALTDAARGGSVVEAFEAFMRGKAFFGRVWARSKKDYDAGRLFAPRRTCLAQEVADRLLRALSSSSRSSGKSPSARPWRRMGH
ncbi:MAG: cobalamin-dependent protein [Elusimicrobiota bacterium]